MSSSFFPVNEALKTHTLPSLPNIVMELLRALESGDIRKQATELVHIDAALAAGTLSLVCNQRATNAHPLRSLSHALELIDPSRLQAFITSTGVRQYFSCINQRTESLSLNKENPDETDHPLVFLKQFWKHSLSSALIAKSLATLTRYPFPEEAYLTGLLHNIGELVLAQNYPSDWQELLLNTSNQETRLELESDLFSSSHAELGASLAKKWGLGDYAVDAIRYHHANSEALIDAHHLSKIIHLASLFSTQDAIKNQGYLDLGKRFFNISTELSQQILIQIQQQVTKTSNQYAVDVVSDTFSQIDEIQLKKFTAQAQNSALLQISRQHLFSAQNHFDLHTKIRDMIELIFHYTNAQVLIYDPQENSLKLTPDTSIISTETDNRIATQASSGQIIELSIPLNSSKSLVARSAIEKTIISSLDPFNPKITLSVVDHQLIRLTQSKDFICVPMLNGQKLVGVLVMGTQESHSGDSTQQNNMLSHFSRQAAKACMIPLNETAAPQDQLAIASMHRQAVEIAHEANNPLTIIRNYTETLSQHFSQDSEIQQELDIVKEELERASDIITQLRDLAPEHQSSSDAVDINQEIRHLVKLFQGSLFQAKDYTSAPISSQLDLDERLEPIKANRNALRQIITNLVKNSVEAFQKPVSITRTEENFADSLLREHTIFINTTCSVNVNGRSFVEMIIADNGNGIETERFNHLFEPISSEKGEGHSGLGLNITRNLVSDLGGSITCRRRNQGVEFQILLPFKPAQKSKPAQQCKPVKKP